METKEWKRYIKELLDSVLSKKKTWLVTMIDPNTLESYFCVVYADSITGVRHAVMQKFAMSDMKEDDIATYIEAMLLEDVLRSSVEDDVVLYVKMWQ